MRISRRVAQFPSQQFEHAASTLGVNVLLVKPPRQLLLVLVANHLEEVDVTVQSFVFVFAEFLDYWNSTRRKDSDTFKNQK